jgi:hypothetical protein
MTNKQLKRPGRNPTADICAAADLPRRMMSELHALRTGTTSPLLAMAIDARELREQLHELFETVRMLTTGLEPRHAQDLTDKALGLIKQLARVLDYLAREAQAESHTAPPGLDCSGMAC